MVNGSASGTFTLTLDSGSPQVRPAVARGTGSLKDFDDEELSSMLSAAPTAPKVNRPCRFFGTPSGCRNGPCVWRSLGPRVCRQP